MINETIRKGLLSEAAADQRAEFLGYKKTEHNTFQWKVSGYLTKSPLKLQLQETKS